MHTKERKNTMIMLNYICFRIWTEFFEKPVESPWFSVTGATPMKNKSQFNPKNLGH